MSKSLVIIFTTLTTILISSCSDPAGNKTEASGTGLGKLEFKGIRAGMSLDEIYKIHPKVSEHVVEQNQWSDYGYSVISVSNSAFTIAESEPNSISMAFCKGKLAKLEVWFDRKLFNKVLEGVSEKYKSQSSIKYEYSYDSPYDPKGSKSVHLKDEENDVFLVLVYRNLLGDLEESSVATHLGLGSLAIERPCFPPREKVTDDI